MKKNAPGGCGCCGCDVREYQLWPDSYDPITIKCFVKTRVKITTTVGEETPTVEDNTTDTIDEEPIAGRWKFLFNDVVTTDDEEVETTVEKEVWVERRLALLFDVSDQFGFGEDDLVGSGDFIKQSGYEALVTLHQYPGANFNNFNPQMTFYGFYETGTLPADEADFESMKSSAPNSYFMGNQNFDLPFDVKSWLPASLTANLVMLIDNDTLPNSGGRLDGMRFTTTDRTLTNYGLDYEYNWKLNFERIAIDHWRSKWEVSKPGISLSIVPTETINHEDFAVQPSHMDIKLIDSLEDSKFSVTTRLAESDEPVATLPPPADSVTRHYRQHEAVVEGEAVVINSYDWTLSSSGIYDPSILFLNNRELGQNVNLVVWGDFFEVGTGGHAPDVPRVAYDRIDSESLRLDFSYDRALMLSPTVETTELADFANCKKMDCPSGTCLYTHDNLHLKLSTMEVTLGSRVFGASEFTNVTRDGCEITYATDPLRVEVTHVKAIYRQDFYNNYTFASPMYFNPYRGASNAFTGSGDDQRAFGVGDPPPDDTVTYSNGTWYTDGTVFSNDWFAGHGNNLGNGMNWYANISSYFCEVEPEFHAGTYISGLLGDLDPTDYLYSEAHADTFLELSAGFQDLPAGPFPVTLSSDDITLYRDFDQNDGDPFVGFTSVENCLSHKSYLQNLDANPIELETTISVIRPFSEATGVNTLPVLSPPRQPYGFQNGVRLISNSAAPEKHNIVYIPDPEDISEWKPVYQDTLQVWWFVWDEDKIADAQALLNDDLTEIWYATTAQPDFVGTAYFKITAERVEGPISSSGLNSGCEQREVFVQLTYKILNPVSIVSPTLPEYTYDAYYQLGNLGGTVLQTSWPEDPVDTGGLYTNRFNYESSDGGITYEVTQADSSPGFTTYDDFTAPETPSFTPIADATHPFDIAEREVDTSVLGTGPLPTPSGGFGDGKWIYTPSGVTLTPSGTTTVPREVASLGVQTITVDEYSGCDPAGASSELILKRWSPVAFAGASISLDKTQAYDKVTYEVSVFRTSIVTIYNTTHELLKWHVRVGKEPIDLTLSADVSTRWPLNRQDFAKNIEVIADPFPVSESGSDVDPGTGYTNNHAEQNFSAGGAYQHERSLEYLQFTFERVQAADIVVRVIEAV